MPGERVGSGQSNYGSGSEDSEDADNLPWGGRGGGEGGVDNAKGDVAAIGWKRQGGDEKALRGEVEAEIAGGEELKGHEDEADEDIHAR